MEDEVDRGGIFDGIDASMPLLLDTFRLDTDKIFPFSLSIIETLVLQLLFPNFIRYMIWNERLTCSFILKVSSTRYTANS